MGSSFVKLCEFTVPTTFSLNMFCQLIRARDSQLCVPHSASLSLWIFYIEFLNRSSNMGSIFTQVILLMVLSQWIDGGYKSS